MGVQILALTAMKTSSPPHCYLNMATLNRRRPRGPKAKPKEAGPVAYVGRLRHLLDAQLTLKDALETAEDDDVVTTVERALERGNVELTEVISDYLQRPFSGGNRGHPITDGERAALRELRKSVTEELFVPSNFTKERLDAAIKSLVKVTDDNDETAEALEWEPERYRVLDNKDPRKTGCVRIYIGC
jgi:hypothetical protein